MLESSKHQENSDNIPIPAVTQVESNEISVEKENENIIQYKLRSSESSSNVRKLENNKSNQNNQAENNKNKSLNKIGSFRSVSSGNHQVHDFIESHAFEEHGLFRSMGPSPKLNQFRLESIGSVKSGKMHQIATTERKDLSRSQALMDNGVMTQRSADENHKIAVKNIEKQSRDHRPID